MPVTSGVPVMESAYIRTTRWQDQAGDVILNIADGQRNVSRASRGCERLLVRDVDRVARQCPWGKRDSRIDRDRVIGGCGGTDTIGDGDSEGFRAARCWCAGVSERTPAIHSLGGSGREWHFGHY